MNYREVIASNFEALSESTQVTVELATLALEKELVSPREFEILTSPVGTNYDKATVLYTKIARKWTESEFDAFLSVLKRTGNARAVKIISSRSSEPRSFNSENLLEETSDQGSFDESEAKIIAESNSNDTKPRKGLRDAASPLFQFQRYSFEVDLKKDRNYSHEDIVEKILADKSLMGSFEGYMLQDEMEANHIKDPFKSKLSFNVDLIKVILASKTKRKERLVHLMSSGKVWWNPVKPQLPPGYIDRRVLQLNQSGDNDETTLLDLMVPNSIKSDDWSKCEDQVLILLVDFPGMGKSCALTRLEQELREKLDKTPRIIVRIDLNTVGDGVDGDVKNGFQKVIRDLFEPLKKSYLGEGESPVYVLLDGQDEVLPQNYESVLSVIRSLLSDRGIHDGWVVEKVVLTTRPHLKDLIESEFQVAAYSLVPLNQEEQVKFIQKRTGRKDARELLGDLDSTMRDLMSNPLMLAMFCSVVDEKTDSFDQYEIYMKFMVKRHELYISEKIGRSNVSNRVLKQMLTSNFRFYNYVAVRETLGEDNLSTIVDLADKTGNADIIQKLRSPDKQSELISYGVVVKVGQELRFAHRSFAEFFYAKLMTDIQNAPKELRNALFAIGYEVGTNLASFVSCVITRNEDALYFLSPGWTQFVPDKARLSRYVGNEKKMKDHTLTTAIEYDKYCEGRNRLLVRDCYEDKIFFRWLSQEFATSKLRIRGFLLIPTMSDFLAAIAFSTDKEIDQFMDKFLLADLETRNRVQILVQCCPTPIQIAIKWKYVEDINKLHLESVLDKMRIWLSLQELQKCAQECLESEEILRNEIDRNPKLSAFFKSVLPKGKLFFNETSSSSISSQLQITTKDESVLRIRNSLKLSEVEQIRNMEPGNTRADSFIKLIDSALDEQKSHQYQEPSRNPDPINVIVNSYELSWLQSETLTEEEIKYLSTTEESRVSDIVGTNMEQVSLALGEEFLPESFLNFRCKFGEHKGKSLFQCGVPNKFINRVWNEINTETIGSAVSVVKDEDDFSFLNTLEKSVSSNISNDESDTSIIEKYDDILKLCETRGVWDKKLSAYGKDKVVNWKELSLIIRFAQSLDWHSVRLTYNTDINYQRDFEGAVSCVIESIVASRLRPGTDLNCYRLIHQLLLGANVSKKWAQLVSLVVECDEKSLFEIVLNGNRVYFARGERKSGVVLRTVPVWDVVVSVAVESLSRSSGIVVKDETIVQMLVGVVESVQCCRLEDVMEKVKSLVTCGETIKRVFSHWRVLTSIGSSVKKSGGLRSNDDCNNCACALKGIITVYNEIYRSVNWLNDKSIVGSVNLIKMIPVELIEAATDFKEDVKQLIKSNVSEITLKNITDEEVRNGWRWEYHKETEWGLLLSTVNGITVDNLSDALMGDRWSSLLRVLARAIGIDAIRNETEVEHFGLENDRNFWEYARNEMTDGQLFHVAIELRSLVGVKGTAWPGVLEWRNWDNLNAKELVSGATRGEMDEITKFLELAYECKGRSS